MRVKEIIKRKRTRRGGRRQTQRIRLSEISGVRWGCWDYRSPHHKPPLLYFRIFLYFVFYLIVTQKKKKKIQRRLKQIFFFHINKRLVFYSTEKDFVSLTSTTHHKEDWEELRADDSKMVKFPLWKLVAKNGVGNIHIYIHTCTLFFFFLVSTCSLFLVLNDHSLYASI